MANNRRSFLKKSISIASVTSIAGVGGLANSKSNTELSKRAHEYVKDAGMQLSEAYFRGLEERRIAYARQMDVLGAVAGVRGSDDAKPWEAKGIRWD